MWVPSNPPVPTGPTLQAPSLKILHRAVACGLPPRRIWGNHRSRWSKEHRPVEARCEPNPCRKPSLNPSQLPVPRFLLRAWIQPVRAGTSLLVSTVRLPVSRSDVPGCRIRESPCLSRSGGVSAQALACSRRWEMRARQTTTARHWPVSYPFSCSRKGAGRRVPSAFPSVSVRGRSETLERSRLSLYLTPVEPCQLTHSGYPGTG